MRNRPWPAPIALPAHLHLQHAYGCNPPASRLHAYWAICASLLLYPRLRTPAAPLTFIWCAAAGQVVPKGGRVTFSDFGLTNVSHLHVLRVSAIDIEADYTVPLRFKRA